MKTIAYFFWTGAINNMFLDCIASYKKLNFFDAWYILTDNDSILNYYPDFNIISLSDGWSNKRFYLKLYHLRDIKANIGDRIMILDGDTLCRKPLINFFDDMNDIFLTTRHYNFEFKINAGVWGYIKNDNTDKLLDHASYTITHPHSWSKYYNLKVNHPWPNARSLTNIDWPVDQDYLECILASKDYIYDEINILLNIKVHENGSYNCIVSSIHDDIVNKLDPYIIHYKNQNGDKWKQELVYIQQK